jgi:chromosomal replication initiation ATPase DnaA
VSRQLVLSLGHRTALGRDNFLVAPSNEAAVAWIDRWPEWPAPCLLVHGPAGSGKTHLAEVWRARSGAGNISGGQLSEADVPLLAQSGAIVDRADEAAEAALLHLLNFAAENRRFLLLTARRPAVLWTVRLADLRSRLLALPSAAILPPDDALIAAVLVKLFADRQIGIGRGVIPYLMRRIERSFEAAERVVATLDEASLARGRAVTVQLVREVLPSP